VKILCVEDDQSLGELLLKTLEKQNYTVDLAKDGEIGWNLVEVITYDLIILDLLLPKLDGINFCQKLRTHQTYTLTPNSNTPVLLMTALDTVTNKVKGLDAGADDYVVKPFNLEELLARIRALIRRKAGVRTPILTWGKLCLNSNKCEVTYQGELIRLTAKEYEILELFLRNPEQIFSLERLLDRLWTLDDPPSEGAVRAHIKGLRHKLKQMGSDDPFETIYKLGYRLKKPENNDCTLFTQKHLNAKTFTESQVENEISAIWEKFRHSYGDRLSIVQEVVKALKQGRLTQEQQHQAEREAHTLIGSLGSFGLEEASFFCREIHTILQQQNPLGQAEATKLEQLSQAVHQQIEQKKGKFSQSYPLNATSVSVSSTLLIIDLDLAFAEQIATEAFKWGFDSQVTTDLELAKQLLRSQVWNAIILDLNFPGSVDSGLDFLALVHANYPHIPVVTLTAETAFVKRVEAVRLGSQCFLNKPVSPAQVLAAASQVLEQAKFSVARLLLVDDDPQLLHLLETLLKPCGYEVKLLDNPQQFWQTLEEVIPDLLILDLEFPGISLLEDTKEITMTSLLSGVDLCQVIRADYRWNRLPVLILSAHTDQETIQGAFAAGADDFLSKPIIATELITRVQLRLQQRKLWEMMEIDELTRLNWRRKA